LADELSGMIGQHGQDAKFNVNTYVQEIQAIKARIAENEASLRSYRPRVSE
jgi:hypothetical protein